MSGLINLVEKQNKSSISKPRNRLGTFVYPDGRIYVGEFKEGSFHGHFVVATLSFRVRLQDRYQSHITFLQELEIIFFGTKANA